MASDNFTDEAKTVGAAVGAIVEAAGDSEEGRLAAREFGQSAVIIARFVKNSLLPLAAVNFGIDRARDYFSNDFPEEIGRVAASIPDEHLVPPKSMVAGPAIQGLAYAHEEEDLREMFLQLLGTSMNSSTAKSAHPAFVEIIRQLSPEDAASARQVFTARSPIEMAQVIIHEESGGFKVFVPYLLNSHVLDDCSYIEANSRSITLTNFSRLGLVDLSLANFAVGESAYDWVEKHSAFVQLGKTPVAQSKKVAFNKGICTLNKFGLQFAAAVGLV